MYKIAAFYTFHGVKSAATMRDQIEQLASAHAIIGSVLVAPEGVNGTVAGEADGLSAFVDWLVMNAGVDRETVKYANSDEAPFRKFTARLKHEIVALGVDGIDPNQRVGTYVEPADWDELIARDDVLLIDCRNSYEVDVGTFEGAVDPGTESFREFADWAESLDPAQTPRVAMFCTGGIRCEKASSLLLERGIPEVYHLKGGILRYLEQKGGATESWKGECFVFDRRVSVDKQLRPGTWDVCWACRMPVSPADKQHELFEPGVSCHRCYHTFSDEERAAKRERHRQFSSDEAI